MGFGVSGMGREIGDGVMYKQAYCNTDYNQMVERVLSIPSFSLPSLPSISSPMYNHRE